MTAAAIKNVKELFAKPPHWGWVGDLYLAGNDDGVAMRLLDGQEYEPESRKLWRSLCKGAGAVLDIGAHTGIYSIDAWRSGAKAVLSVEPYFVNFCRLMMNLRHAGFDTNSCALVGASDENKEEILSIRTGNFYCSAGGRLQNIEGAPVNCRVPVRRLDTLLNDDMHSRVAVVKIDTEKHGVKVLQGMPKILEHRPDLILECIEPGLGDILRPLGYHFYRIDERTGLTPVDDLVPDNPFTFDAPNRYATVKNL